MAEDESDEDSCKIAAKLELIHKWVHLCTDDFDGQELLEVHQLGREILMMLNSGAGADKGNGIKVLALFEALAVGVDVMEKQLTVKQQWGVSETIH